MKRNLIIAALSAALAISCGGIAFASDATSPSSMSMSQNAAKPGSDAWITARIKTELSTARDISSANINVTTDNGIVKLSGKLDNQRQVKETVAIAKSVKGVRRVDSTQLKIHAG